jgi:streptogramin lyase
LWFTNAGNDSIGRISTAGAVTNFTGTGISHPGAITPGLKGALWFTNTTHSIGEITTSGTVTISGGKGVARPMGVAESGSTTMWFTEYRSNMMSEGSKFTRGRAGATAGHPA